MKPIISVLFCAFLLLTVNGCRREKTATIEGRLLDSCINGQPMANTKVYFRMVKFGGHTEALAETTTDANGHFSVTYTTRSRNSIEMSTAGVDVMHDIPSKRNVDLGDVYVHYTAGMVVKVHANNSHAGISETLHVNSGSGENFQLETPFHDTIFPAVSRQRESYRSYNYTNYGTYTNKTSWSYTNGLFPSEHQDTELNFCTPAPDTLVITID